jgi:hypothetical protein
LALFAGYRDVMERESLYLDSPLTSAARQQLFCAFIAVGRLTAIDTCGVSLGEMTPTTTRLNSR